MRSAPTYFWWSGHGSTGSAHCGEPAHARPVGRASSPHAGDVEVQSVPGVGAHVARFETVGQKGLGAGPSALPSAGAGVLEDDESHAARGARAKTARAAARERVAPARGREARGYMAARVDADDGRGRG